MWRRFNILIFPTTWLLCHCFLSLFCSLYLIPWLFSLPPLSRFRYYWFAISFIIQLPFLPVTSHLSCQSFPPPHPIPPHPFPLLAICTRVTERFHWFPGPPPPPPPAAMFPGQRRPHPAEMLGMTPPRPPFPSPGPPSRGHATPPPTAAAQVCSMYILGVNLLSSQYLFGRRDWH